MRVLDPRLLERTRGVRALVTLDVVVGVAAALLLLLQATLFAEIVARAFDGAGLRRLTPQLALLALTFAARGAAAVAFEVAGRRAATTVLSDLRLALLQSRLRGRPAAHDGVETAEVAAAAVQGVEGLEAYFGRYLPQLVLACTVPVVVLVFVATVDPLSALIMLLTLPLVPVFMWLIGRYSEERARERWRTLGLLSAHFLDVVRGLPTLRAYDRGRAQVKTIAEVGERYRSATMGTLRVAFLSGSVLELAATLGVALVAVSIGVRLVGGSLALQSGLTALVLAPELYLPFRRLGAEFHASADGLVVAERILELLDVAGPPAAIDAAGVAPSPATGAIRFESVSFAYPARPGVVLEKLDFELLPGETVALVGPSGAGKSTVAALLLRLAEPTDGRITCGGVDLARSDPGAWRRQVAWVPQHPTIFRGTAAENIRLGSPDATHAEVREAARLAGADAFLRALPDGYETLLGDGGRSLSAGEKRRVALARAFLRAAPFVVLDEPTADLDPESAALVADAVDELRAGRTVLVIAHRAELVERADRVILLGGSRAHALEAA